jgi:hypothetical protein
MGLRNIGKTLSADKKEIDTERLCERFQQYGFLKLGEIRCRERVKVAGEIKRMRIKPRSGIPAVEVAISDGTGEVTVIFSGRRNIPGIDHGRCIMIDGVPHRDGAQIVMLNPAYTLLA